MLDASLHWRKSVATSLCPRRNIQKEYVNISSIHDPYSSMFSPFSNNRPNLYYLTVLITTFIMGHYQVLHYIHLY